MVNWPPANVTKGDPKRPLISCHIDPKQRTSFAADRDGRHHTIHKAVATLENSHRDQLREKRLRRKYRVGIMLDLVASACMATDALALGLVAVDLDNITTVAENNHCSRGNAERNEPIGWIYMVR